MGSAPNHRVAGVGVSASEQRLTQDRQQASALVIGLSGTITTVALGGLASGVALVAVIANDREVGPAFWLIVVMAVLALALSTFLGGKGVAEIARHGATGDWRTRTNSGYFNAQTFIALAGTLGLVAAAAVGLSATSTAAVARSEFDGLARQVDVLNQDVLRLRERIAHQRSASAHRPQS